MNTNEPLKVIAGTPDRPLVIGDIEIPCYVLEDETRVITQSGFLQAIGRSRTPKAGTGGMTVVDDLPFFLRATQLRPFISKELRVSTTPILFAIGPNRKVVGYRAELLPQVCNVYLEARDAGALLPSQQHIATRAEILIRGLATVGIIALVDEATGYQRIREERALATILEKFIAKDLQPWTKTFPYEFYEQIFRLKGWSGPAGARGPRVLGRYTNDLVYERLAPGVLDELRRRTPMLPNGQRPNKFFQWFTPDLGHPRLKEHLAAVIALMKAAPNWTGFKRSLQRALPKLNETIPMPFDE